MTITLDDSVLPKTCPVCGSECVQHDRQNELDNEGATYDCELSLYVENSEIIQDQLCGRSLTTWLRSRNEDLRTTA